MVALAQHYRLDVTTGTRFVDQWANEYFSMAFPSCIPRPVSGADFPNRARQRRHEGAPLLPPFAFTKMLAARSQGGVRWDWLGVPSAQNLSTQFGALCGAHAASRSTADESKAGNVMAAALVTAAQGVYEKLQTGECFDGRRTRKTYHDVSKLQYAVGLTRTQRDISRDLCFPSSKQPGPQQIRLVIAHALFGTRSEFGEPLFIHPSLAKQSS